MKADSSDGAVVVSLATVDEGGAEAMLSLRQVAFMLNSSLTVERGAWCAMPKEVRGSAQPADREYWQARSDGAGYGVFHLWGQKKKSAKTDGTVQQ